MNRKLSKCCQVEVCVVGIETMHYECKKCRKPCDVVTKQSNKDINSVNRKMKLSPHDIDSTTNFDNSIISSTINPLLVDQTGSSPDYEFCNGRTKGEIFDKINELVQAVNKLNPYELSK